MKNSINITVLAACAALLCGCDSSSIGQPGTMTQILLAPSVYGNFTDGAATRAVDLARTDETGYEHYAYNDFHGEPVKTTLPIGSTVWLTYRKSTAAPGSLSEPYDPESMAWEESSLQAYIVQNSAGYNALYPIKSHEEEGGYLVVDRDENGEIKYTNPLYLKDGYYQFRMVSPANKILKSNLKMQVDNGMYVYANDERYTETRSSVIEVKDNNLGVQNIILNPMINQTARFKVTLRPGDNVSSMEMMAQGIEISGLQNPERESGGKLMFQWSSMSLQDTLQMKKADKYSRVSMKEFTTHADGSITGEIGILPTDSKSTVTVFLINMAVNGIPTQYLLTLYQMVFIHGHSYNLDLEIGLDGDIRVMNWANQAWSGEVKFQ